MLHPGVRAFDETERQVRQRDWAALDPPTAEEEAAAAEAAGDGDGAAPGSTHGAPAAAATATMGVTAATEVAGGAVSGARDSHGSDDALNDAEAAAAFAFCDLSGKRYIGAAELRHLLVCMVSEGEKESGGRAECGPPANEAIG